MLGEPAIDDHFRSEHVARCIAREEQDCRGDFVRLSKSTERNQLSSAFEIVAKLGIGLTGMFGLAHAPKNGRVDQPWTDRVYADAPGEQLGR